MKKFFSILIAVLMLLAFTACGKVSENGSGDAVVTDSESSQTQNGGGSEKTDKTDVPQYTADPAVQQDCKNPLFHKGLLQVKYNGKYGYIDLRGSFVIEPQFDFALEFADNGLAPVRMGDKWGFIDMSGSIVIEPQFEDLGYLARGGYHYDYFGAGFAANGLAAVKINGKWGYIDESGNMAIEAKFMDASKFCDNGIARVQDDDGTITGYTTYGFINESGEFINDERYQFCGNEWKNGLEYFVKWDGNSGYINENGEIVLDLGLSSMELGGFADNGLARVGRKYINMAGETVIDASFKKAKDFSYNGLAPVSGSEFDNKTVYIDASGNVVIDGRYDDGYGFALNGLALVVVDGKCGYIDSNGNMVIQPQFDKGSDFYDDGYAIVAIGSEWGIIDSSGNFIMELRFERIF